MSWNPGFKRLWWLMGSLSLAIALVTYLVVVPVVKGQTSALRSLEASLLRDQLLPTQALGEAAVSGGLSRGGSFSRPAPVSPSRPQPMPRPSYDHGDRLPPGPVIIPYPTYSPTPVPVYVDTSDGDGADGILVVIILGLILLPILLSYLQSHADAPGAARLGPERVTVTGLQLALLAQARSLQQDLNQIALGADLSTAQGLAAQLQETVLALLRYPEYWSHCALQSQTLGGRPAAAKLFERLSLQERSKFRVETLANRSGQIERRSLPHHPPGEETAYLVVTLLIGTTHDRPLVSPVNSVMDLRRALQTLGSIPADQLLVYELLWTPQDPTDSLSSDDLLANYPDLITL
ncbi:MAG: DUF1517 domain-containing protein [Cyanobacteriota bacterium]|nr:DUF1517 domain-containing protein [Cyanobacteriota bacterium]